MLVFFVRRHELFPQIIMFHGNVQGRILFQLTHMALTCSQRFNMRVFQVLVCTYELVLKFVQISIRRY